MSDNWIREYDAMRCQVLFDLMYAVEQLEATNDNTRLLGLIRRQLPEDLRSVRFLTDDEAIQGQIRGWIRTRRQNGLVPGWTPVGPGIAVVMMTDSDSDSVEAAENVENVAIVEDLAVGLPTVYAVPVAAVETVETVNTGGAVQTVEPTETFETVETVETVGDYLVQGDASLDN